MKENPFITFGKSAIIYAVVYGTSFFLLEWAIIQLFQKIGILHWFI